MRLSSRKESQSKVAITETEIVAGIGNEYKYGFHDPEDYFFKSGRGLSPDSTLPSGSAPMTWIAGFCALR